MEPKIAHISTFKIEPPKVGDEFAIGPMHVKAWKESYVNPELGATEEVLEGMIGHLAHDTEFRKKTILEALENPDKVLYRVVKNQNGEIVGFLHGSKNDQFNELEGIYTLDEVKGKGVGGKLMREFLEWSDKNKPSHLEVFSFNERALGFYQKYGFVRTDKPTQLYKDKLPYIEMIRPINEK